MQALLLDAQIWMEDGDYEQVGDQATFTFELLWVLFSLLMVHFLYCWWSFPDGA